MLFIIIALQLVTFIITGESDSSSLRQDKSLDLDITFRPSQVKSTPQIVRPQLKKRSLGSPFLVGRNRKYATKSPFDPVRVNPKKKSEEDKSKEDKSKEEMSKEEKSKEEKSKGVKSRDEKSKDKQSKKAEDKSGKEKPRKQKRGRSKNRQFVADKLPLQVKKGNLVKRFKDWGPHYHIAFEIKLTGPIQDQGEQNPIYLNLFHFSATNQSCCQVGDRIPGELGSFVFFKQVEFFTSNTKRCQNRLTHVKRENHRWRVAKWIR